jgi:predicted metalloendopeptidase
MKVLRAALIVGILSSFSFAQQASSPTAKQNNAGKDKAPLSSDQIKLSHLDPSLVDKSKDPCNDFYAYVCSKWQAENPIPADQSTWSTESNLALWNQTVLRETMETAEKGGTSRDPVHQKIGDYYGACMDVPQIDKEGITPLKPALDAIAAMKSKKDLPAVLAQVHKMFPASWEGGNNQTSAPFFGYGPIQDFKDASLVVAGVDQGGMGMPGRDFYLKDDEKSKAIRSKYEQHVHNMFVLAGEKDQQAAADAKTVLDIETGFARAAMDPVKRRDPKNIYNVMTAAQVQQLTPSFDWAVYDKDIASPTPKHYVVTSPDFFKALDQSINQHSLQDWQTYLRWWTLHNASGYLSQPFVDESFSFFGKTLFGAQELRPRWRRCVSFADRDLGEALGQAYVDRAFPPSSRDRIIKLVNSIEQALHEDIHQIDWMSPETKQQAELKLKAIEDKMGYPKKWRDYSSVKIVPNDLVANVNAATAFELKRQLDKIGKPVDRAEWGMTPPTINAYYDPQLNTINFPAGILQPPFFDPNQSDAANYGAIGMVIGHEITHGFDDQGRQFDAKGDLRDWWTPEDAKRYEERGNCIANKYTHDVPELGVKTNGKLTQGEDTADNGGMRIAFMALEDTLKKEGKSMDQKGADGYTPAQRFFLAQAFEWCQNERPEIQRTQILTNPHSLAKYRVNFPDSNFPEFGKAFGCKPGSPMMPENACRVW